MTYTKGNIRYQRQTSLKEFGETGQEKLSNAKVLVVGAGGLGSPALQYLAGAGIGTLGIVDHDIVSLSNLHRQTLFSSDDIGLSKALRAQEFLTSLNPEIDIIAHHQMLDTTNTLEIFSSYDFVLDGTDNFATRYMINDACVLSNKVLIYGAVSRFEGQVAVFNCRADHRPERTNYRDLFPNPPADGEILNCEEAGVIGVLPGIIGMMMASETIKLLTGMGTPLVNKLLTYNLLNNQIYELELTAQVETNSFIPKSLAEFKKADYGWLCSSHSGLEIDQTAFDQFTTDSSVKFIDVRQPGEIPLITDLKHTNIPLGEIQNIPMDINEDTIVFFCQSGARSLRAAALLSERFGQSKKIYSLKNGIVAWKNLRKE